ncbi:hypothetical protein PSTG_02513 [Puccinia striiformis f. sp. tritici PST-78]|uniref:Uncharacterized protein n=1 Tax=Puccinia striiformis f. sp. tritici PST-78 TaxID=1165861 RepID=A0A0L0VY93_9BASI|nr:hypothetical protein PSTG_02513 [Puccinia striiformis f. sp. tritici PST-78]
MESYEEWEEASSLVEASKAKAFSAQDEQDFTVVKTMPPSHKALNVHCDFRHAQPLSMNV